jgi:zinc/manganese transport system permease protein
MNLLREYLIEPFSYGFMQRGVLSAILLSLSGGILGPVLILRRLALMGDALAHSLLPGVALAYLLFGPNLAALFLGSLFAGLLTGAGSALLSRLTRIKEDAAFGALFVIFFAAGIAIVSTLRTKIDLMHFLFGNILAVSPTDLGVSGAACAITLGVFIVLRRSILLETFDPIFHRATGGRGGLTHVGLLCLTVINLVAALQAMGIVLALGLFLLPAVTAYLWCDRLKQLIITSVALAAAGSILGILISYHANLASGASIVLTLGAAFLVSAVISPKYGVIARLKADRGEARGVVHRAD